VDDGKRVLFFILTLQGFENFAELFAGAGGIHEMEILIMWNSMKDSKLKKAGVDQMRILSNLFK